MILKIKDEYLELIKLGKKQSTIRKGMAQVDSINLDLQAVSSEEIIKVEITELKFKKYKDITLYDIHVDGFKTFEQFHETLLSFYPDLKDDDIMTIIYFDYK